MAKYEEISFTVDSALLVELGERLVGRPYMALAELIKNSYDADANLCSISIQHDSIEIEDDGNGMSDREFIGHWMRIGTTNKQRDFESRNLGRTVTGSKGIGRLSAQLLGSHLSIESCSETARKRAIECIVDWNEAIEAGNLTEAPARFRAIDRKSFKFAGGSPHGTRIKITGLAHSWDPDTAQDLAREIWRLQPPPQVSSVDRDPRSAFKVVLRGDESLVQAFDSQTVAALENWQARITGKVDKGRKSKKATVVVEFRDGKKYTRSYRIPNGAIESVNFQIRVFKLSGKQPGGIPVREARDYFEKFGGIHVYDQDFRLPYYGIEEDWLGIEQDHSHRLTLSKLLPEGLQVERGMQDLPSLKRVFGVVEVSTAVEMHAASADRKKRRDFLQIQITRDRLVDNKAFQDLKFVVRWAVDFYATRVQVRRIEEAKKEQSRKKRSSLSRAKSIVAKYKKALPKKIANQLETEIDDAIVAERAKERVNSEERSLLGALASAGMAAISVEHEVGKELTTLQRLVSRLRRAVKAPQVDRKQILEVATEFSGWIRRVRATRKMFSPLMSEADRSEKARLKASPTLRQVVENSRPLMRNIKVDLDLPASLRLPESTMANWNAIFQNVLLNAVNAMIDSTEKTISCSGGKTRGTAYILVQDTGAGVNLETSEDLFKPFYRELEISDQRRELGLGGAGLGLTIVRMIADSIGCVTQFVAPEPGYKTAFRVSWKDS